jgi:hypothetical protein
MKKAPNPTVVIDMSKVTVYELLQMIERGEKNAYYMLLSLKSAEARMLADNKPEKKG